MISSGETLPYKRTDDLGEGDELIFPCGTKIFRVGHVLEDGSYGGDVCRADNPNCLIDWIWLTPDDIVEQRLRVYPVVPAALN